MKLRLLHLYHDIMDLYGDKGNIKTIQYRLKKRNMKLDYDTCGIGEKKNFSDYDLIFMGGGADLEQKILSKDLLGKKEYIQSAMADGVNFLLICGGYQLFGQYYVNAAGEKIDGLNLLDYFTQRPEKKSRCIGNILIESELDAEKVQIAGFENHSGQTLLKDEKKYFGKVKIGNGNRFASSIEGYMDKQCIGTYIHGPLLPKNPRLADFVIKRAMKRKNGDIILSPLDDDLENFARKEIVDAIS